MRTRLAHEPAHALPLVVSIWRSCPRARAAPEHMCSHALSPALSRPLAVGNKVHVLVCVAYKSAARV